MPYDLTHASFFSGVGGLDLGLERAGWRTVSFSEIDPYASAVLAERWPAVPNLGDITAVVRPDNRPLLRGERGQGIGAESREWHRAVLWTGGFPCQDLSVAGKRRGFEGERSVLAFAFLDLVERHRPPAILLENVPGLLSSHAGKDFGALLGRLAELGYWWAYRVLDAQFFGVPQRRRRVFICALHAGAGFGADGPAEVLSVGARCGGHSAAGDEAGPGVAQRPGHGLSHALTAQHSTGRLDANGETFAVAGTIRSHQRPGSNSLDAVLSPSPDASRVREADGLAGRVDDREVVGTLRVGAQKPQDGGPGDTVPIIAATLNSGGNDGGFRTEPGEHLITGLPHRRLPLSGVPDLLPLGLDSHRYRCCGNGVVAPVSEWIGWRIRAAIEANAEVAA